MYPTVKKTLKGLYGDYQGNGPYEDTYLIDNISRNIQAGRYEHPDSSELPPSGFYFGMLHGGWLAKPSDTLVVITDQDFSDGYQEGLQKPSLLTDQTLTSLLHEWACRGIGNQALAYELGKVAGSLSHVLIPEVVRL